MHRLFVVAYILTYRWLGIGNRKLQISVKADYFSANKWRSNCSTLSDERMEFLCHGGDGFIPMSITILSENRAPSVHQVFIVLLTENDIDDVLKKWFSLQIVADSKIHTYKRYLSSLEFWKSKNLDSIIAQKCYGNDSGVCIQVPAHPGHRGEYLVSKWPQRAKKPPTWSGGNRGQG